MAERKREKTFDEINDVSAEEYHKADEGTYENYKAQQPSPDMPCKTCKYSQVRYDGVPLKSRRHPNYMAGTCEKYDVKPSKVYFDAKPCPEYVAK